MLSIWTKSVQAISDNAHAREFFGLSAPDPIIHELVPGAVSPPLNTELKERSTMVVDDCLPPKT